MYVWQGIGIVTDGPDRRLGRALAGCDWPGLEIQRGRQGQGALRWANQHGVAPLLCRRSQSRRCTGVML